MFQFKIHKKWFSGGDANNIKPNYKSSLPQQKCKTQGNDQNHTGIFGHKRQYNFTMLQNKREV